MVIKRSLKEIGQRRKSTRYHDRKVRLKNRSIVVKVVQFYMEKRFQFVFFASRNSTLISSFTWATNISTNIKRLMKDLSAQGIPRINPK